ncbi:MAG TPA: cystathionine gamma-synthase [Methylomusa anaerophila]|uniref:Cystathionine beta-lyase n=1 Tax=Methylomusa anaerophila TaxID=1930071 RepID=A0A348AF22_9FIRM|nr:cystathionine gamma-synthase [Methylomusa anaerophila]BBB89670.1 cystathionine beta-lyase [Methylomusa anaerophila]HML89553.1 cystathionine gamma-synthase [Methylomusa anaerophila]
MGKYEFSTRAIHSGQEPDSATGAIITPIYATSTFVQESPGIHRGYEYSRSGNPTRAALEECIASLEEGTAGFAFSSGLAAESVIIDTLARDSHIVATNDLYGGTFRLFEKVKKDTHNLEISYVDMTEPEAVEKAVKTNTRMIWVETPTNPLLKIIDLKKVASIAAKYNIISVCDNTFASSYLQKPLNFGFDIVIHSATKYLNGHSDIIGGLIVTKNNNELTQKIKFLQNAIGSVLSPFDSFLLLRGLKTLAVRMDAHCKNAKKIAQFLEQHPKVEKVIYPGLPTNPYHEIAKSQMNDFGGMVSFYLKGGAAETQKFLEKTRLFALAESLGGVESLVEAPAIMTHASIPKEVREQNGIYDNLVRLSVGIEDVKDLIADLDNAL